MAKPYTGAGRQFGTPPRPVVLLGVDAAAEENLGGVEVLLPLSVRTDTLWNVTL